LRTLYILRHATAAPSGPSGDISRALAPEGVKEAEAMGRFLSRAGLIIDGVVCSSAVRARQTAEGVLRGLESKRDPDVAPELYNASGPELLRWLQDQDGEYAKLLIVAHMPGVGELLSLLTTEHNDLAMGYATATLAIVTGEAHWEDWDYGRGTLQMLVPAGAAVKS
jgi:phosphohistidine phosphatase